MSSSDQPPESSLILYRTEDGQTRISVRLEEGTVWLTQRLMAELFQVGVGTVNHHVKGIYEDHELVPEATIRHYRIVQSEGGREVTRTDVTVAKNYLSEEEIAGLNRIVTMFLDFAEDQASRKKQVFLRDWRTKLDDFLRFNERAVLPDAGRLSREAADRKALAEYDTFAAQRRATLEAAGEAEAIQQLEAAAKKLPQRKKKS